jgi:MSHA biogenesis protein MshK
MTVLSSLRAGPLLAALALSGMAWAQGALVDPTRPPNALAPMGGGGAGAGGEEAASTGPRLQSVLISPNRRLAVIDGRTVPLGGTVAGAVLVQVAETHVVLKQGAETRTLDLHPGVSKKKGKP